MDREKTGGLIASARKERGLTQKELAAQLHVSDRAVSKWERGAGFPDVSLLEPLADALGVQVLDLLRGEETDTPEPEMTVRRAIVLLVRQTREKTRRRWGQILGGLIAALMVGFVLFAVLDRTGVFLRDVSPDRHGSGLHGRWSACGRNHRDHRRHTKGGRREVLFRRFAIACVEPTCREEAWSTSGWDAMK